MGKSDYRSDFFLVSPVFLLFFIIKVNKQFTLCLKTAILELKTAEFLHQFSNCRQCNASGADMTSSAISGKPGSGGVKEWTLPRSFSSTCFALQTYSSIAI